jgi:hypothetical protein
MYRLIGILLLMLLAQAHADCELPYAPREVRAVALNFHQRLEARDAKQGRNAANYKRGNASQSAKSGGE